ncbi:MAG: hypothetical protein E7222_10430 [Clostridiales bacterium]|jgi:hypothetical protein|nr:hypothetical protein [Clostridiales bacterium]
MMIENIGWKMKNNINVHEFTSILNSIIDERFPNTERYMISGGDYFRDVVIELREAGKTLQYSPSKLFEESQNYDDTIDELIETWESIL